MKMDQTYKILRARKTGMHGPRGVTMNITTTITADGLLHLQGQSEGDIETETEKITNPQVVIVGAKVEVPEGIDRRTLEGLPAEK